MGNKLISSVPALIPTRVYDANTGEELPIVEWEAPVRTLLEYATAEAKRLCEAHAKLLQEKLVAYTGTPQAAEYGRQLGLVQSLLPREVKAQSRIERLVRHKVISEYSAYVLNPNPKKQPPSYYPKVSLGAVDSQMATLSIVETMATLLWKVWDRELLLEFELPGYLNSRQVTKWCLPEVAISKRTGQVVFRYAYEENPAPNPTSRLRAGVDLGRVEPYTAAVITPAGKRVASYVSSNHLWFINDRREALLKERKQILSKADHYAKLGLNDEALRTEAARKRAKITRLGVAVAQELGSELSRKLAKHKLSVMHVEELGWATGARYGSKWNHGMQQQALSHGLARSGTHMREVSAKDTSKLCHGCSEALTYRSDDRTVWCGTCKTRLDRDWNASLRIAKTSTGTTRYPVSQRVHGAGCSCSIEQQACGVHLDGHTSKPRRRSLATVNAVSARKTT